VNRPADSGGDQRGRNDRKIDDKKMKKRKEEVEGPLRQGRLVAWTGRIFYVINLSVFSVETHWPREAGSPEPPEGGTTNRMKNS
jgi:hypothetical protein